jgi:hypothetical protein
VLRQPLEDGVVHVARVHASYAYPADFCLVAAMNPCPCGYYGDVFRQCTCTPGNVQKYQKGSVTVKSVRTGEGKVMAEIAMATSEEIEARMVRLAEFLSSSSLP